MKIPVEWMLAAIVSLGGVIATLSGVLSKFVKSRLEAQDKLIAAQGRIISKLQNDIDRLSKGCGHASCLWKNR
jgi:hypothetical protein